MRLLAVLTVVTALTVTGCASTNPAVTGGSGSDRASASAPASAPGSAPGSVPGATGAGGSRSAVPSAPVDARCPARPAEGRFNGRQARPVPSGIEVDWVLRCRVAGQSDGSRFLVVERSDSDPAALLAALRAPDEPRSSGVCLTVRPVVPYFALIQRDGRAWAPKVPVTGCGMPQTAVLQALNRMHFQAISRQRLP